MTSQGSKTYFTHKPCSKGHISWRYIKSNKCVQCAKEQAAKWRKDNPARCAALQKNFRLKNPQYPTEYYKKNVERLRPIHKARANARHAMKLQRTPPWADVNTIEQFYKDCPDGYHVDHYYPLQGEVCSGLHVLENLRHIPAAENLAKNNKMPEIFYSAPITVHSP